MAKNDRLPFECPVTSFPSFLWCHLKSVTLDIKFPASLWGVTVVLACWMFQMRTGPLPLQNPNIHLSTMHHPRDVGITFVFREATTFWSETFHMMILLSAPAVAKRSEFVGCHESAVMVLRCSATMECSLNSLYTLSSWMKYKDREIIYTLHSNLCPLSDTSSVDERVE